MEFSYLNLALNKMSSHGLVLDLGCGSSEPIARFFIENGCKVTGVDGSSKMIELCISRFPNETWLHADMREINLNKKFDLIIAWNSYFHLSQNDQKLMFRTFDKHLKINSLLLFTTGPSSGEIYSEMNGQQFYHSSLTIDEYRFLLVENGFEVLINNVEDPNCGNQTVWLARKIK